MRNRLESLTGLRFIAAALVLAYHFVMRLQLVPAGSGVDNLLNQGGFGVTIFFILSGFVLAYSYGDRAGKPDFAKKKFFLARFARIYPIYFVALLLGILPSYADMHGAGIPNPLQELSKAFVTHTLLIQAWSPGWVDQAFLNTPGWSLSVETFFYAMFPLCVVPALRFRGRKTFFLGLGCLAVIAILRIGLRDVYASHLAKVGFDDQFTATTRYLIVFCPLVRLPDFLLGVTAGLWFLQQPKLTPPKSAALWTVGSLVALVAILSCHVTDSTDTLIDIGAITATTVLITSLAFGQGLLAKFLSLPILVLLGEASYAMYILQRPLEGYFALAIRKLAHREIASDPLSAIVFLLVVIGVSILAHFKLEIPARAWILRRFGEKSIVADPLSLARPPGSNPSLEAQETNS